MRRTWRVLPLVQSVTRVRAVLHQIVPIRFLGADGGAGFGRDLERVLAGSVCWLEPSLTEAPTPSLLHIEMKMTLVGLIGARPQHRAKDAAGVVAHRFQEYSFGVI